MPPIDTIVETAVYVDDLERAESFYGGVLGLEVLARGENRHVFFRVGASSVLLAFLADETIKGADLPAHGARGPTHFALGIQAVALDAWRQRLADRGVEIEHETCWPLGGVSLYFRDPAGNSVELITPGVWGLSAGW